MKLKNSDDNLTDRGMLHIVTMKRTQGQDNYCIQGRGRGERAEVVILHHTNGCAVELEVGESW